MEMLKAVGVCVLCAAMTVFLHETKSPLSRLFPLAASICVLIFAVSKLGECVGSVGALAEGTAVSGYTGTLLRAVGIGYVAELTADVCRGCGADAAASAVIMLGRAELAVLCCPLLVSLLEAASSVIS